MRREREWVRRERVDEERESGRGERDWMRRESG